MKPQSPWSDDLDLRWRSFIEKMTPTKRKALAFFLRTRDPNEQLDQIKQHIIKTSGESKKAFQLIDEAISQEPNIQRIVYYDQFGRSHMRYTYADRVLNGRKRFFAELMTVRPKDPVRCAEKLVTDREWIQYGGDYKKWLKENGITKLWWQRTEDLAAFRIVCNFLRDIRSVHDLVRRTLRYYKVVPKDFIWNIDRARKRGARSLHLIITDNMDQRRFELQIMTTLQLAWDQSEHVIEYEEKRPEEKEKADHHTMLFRSVSDLLYIADETFDRIYDHWAQLRKGP